VSGLSYYVWENNNPVPPDKVNRFPRDHECFVTGQTISLDEEAHWTDSFDAWVSVRGYQMIQNAQSTGEISNNKQWEIMYGEWYAKDEAISGREEADYNNEEFRSSY